MQTHNVKREHPNKKNKIVGRGGKRGTTSGEVLRVSLPERAGNLGLNSEMSSKGSLN